MRAAYRRQQDHERRVRREINTIKSTASRREHLTQNDFYRRKAKKVARRAVVLERRLERGLDSEDRVEKPTGREYVLPQVAPSARGGDRMLSAEGLRLSAGGRVLLGGASLNIGWGERVVIIGANGWARRPCYERLWASPQPTPAKSAAVRHSSSVTSCRRMWRPPSADLGGEVIGWNRRFTAVIRSTTELSETEARRFLHRFLFEGDAVHTPLHDLSYGERRRLRSRSVLAGALARPRRAHQPPRHPRVRPWSPRSMRTMARSSPSPTTATSPSASHRACSS